MKEEKEVERLRRRVEQLFTLLVHSGVRFCPLCGSRMSKSTRYDWHFCLQELGHCGEWILEPLSRIGHKRPKSHFIRTQMKHGCIRRGDLSYTPFRRILFVAGQEFEEDPATEFNTTVTNNPYHKEADSGEQ